MKTLVALTVANAIVGAAAIALGIVAIDTSDAAMQRMKHLDIIRRAKAKAKRNAAAKQSDEKINAKAVRATEIWKDYVKTEGFTKAIDIMIRPIIADIISTNDFKLEGSMVINDPKYNGDVTLHILMDRDKLVEPVNVLSQEIKDVLPFIKRLYFESETDNDPSNKRAGHIHLKEYNEHHNDCGLKTCNAITGLTVANAVYTKDEVDEMHCKLRDKVDEIYDELSYRIEGLKDTIDGTKHTPDNSSKYQRGPIEMGDL